MFLLSEKVITILLLFIGTLFLLDELQTNGNRISVTFTFRLAHFYEHLRFDFGCFICMLSTADGGSNCILMPKGNILLRIIDGPMVFFALVIGYLDQSKQINMEKGEWN